MSKNTISFKLSNDLSELDTLRDKVEKFGTLLGIPDKTIFEINLIVDELFSNIVSCGFRDNGTHWININISHRDSAITIRVEDDGVPFNPKSSQKPDLECPMEERRIGGLGIHLVTELSDKISYYREGDKNILILEKNILEDSTQLDT
ncbi:MAG: ATP-binding protein [Thermodesulfobacteriota bacterium]